MTLRNMCGLAYVRHIRGMAVDVRAEFDHYLVTGEIPDRPDDGGQGDDAETTTTTMSVAVMREMSAIERIIPAD